jgi:mono/diheme cytochrome c family protein
MKLSRELKAMVLAAVSGLAVIGIALAAGEIFQLKPTAATEASGTASRAVGASGTNDLDEALVIPPAGTQEHLGYTLFMMNCAHCHGNDARGDEGPDLHGVTKSDARITSIIKNGIKGEMPKFGTKLTDADVRALITFVRSLRN